MSRETVKLGLLGHPVAHSLSPLLMLSLGRLARRKIAYRACDVAPEKLACAVELLRWSGMLGCNVTVPHKVAVAPMLDQLTHEARLVGAVNVVRCASNRLIGHNTDAAGCADALREAGFKVGGCTAVIFGAGGAARAAACAKTASDKATSAIERLFLFVIAWGAFFHRLPVARTNASIRAHPRLARGDVVAASIARLD